MFRKTLDRKRTRLERAFTLVELLVVVSIIALLIAILLPSLKKARQSAKRIACNANVRSIAQAGLTYSADDKNEFAIPVGTRDSYGQNKDAYSAYVAPGGKGGLGPSKAVDSIYSGAKLMGSIHRPLNFVIYKGGFGSAQTGSGGGGGRGGSSEDWTSDSRLNLDVYQCPGDKGFPGMHYRGWNTSKLSGYDYFGTSYSCNPYLVGLGLNSPLDSNSIYMRSMSRVPNPTNTILYSEFAMRFAVFATNPEFDQSCCGDWSIGNYTAHGHHGQDWHFTVSFGDGHASWVKIKGYGCPIIGTQDDKMPPSCRPPAASSGYCRCILQRGLDWQVDTLPAELVPTLKYRTQTNGTLVAMTDGSAGGGDWFAIDD